MNHIGDKSNKYQEPEIPDYPPPPPQFNSNDDIRGVAYHSPADALHNSRETLKRPSRQLSKANNEISPSCSFLSKPVMAPKSNSAHDAPGQSLNVTFNTPERSTSSPYAEFGHSMHGNQKKTIPMISLRSSPDDSGNTYVNSAEQTGKSVRRSLVFLVHLLIHTIAWRSKANTLEKPVSRSNMDKVRSKLRSIFRSE